MNNINFEIIDIPTDLEGEYGIAYYYDENHNPVKKDNAKFVSYSKYDKDGKLIINYYGVKETEKDQEKNVK